MQRHTILLDSPSFLGLDPYDGDSWAVLPAHHVRRFAKPSFSFDEESTKNQFEEACRFLDAMGHHMVMVTAAGAVAGRWEVRPYTINESEFAILEAWSPNLHDGHGDWGSTELKEMPLDDLIGFLGKELDRAGIWRSD